jgi:hypothetical protein
MEMNSINRTNYHGVIMIIAGLLLFAISPDNLLAEGRDRYQLEDFSMALEKITSDPAHTWVNSGTTTVNPENQTVMGVNSFYAPPLAATNFGFSVEIDADGLTVPDQRNYGKEDVGLLYSRGRWYPHKIVREGTYHHFKDGKLTSLGVISELVPLFGMNGFVEKITIRNRSSRTLNLQLNAIVNPGNPISIPLEKWGFAPPFSDQRAAIKMSENTWSNHAVTLQLNEENRTFTLQSNESGTAFFTVIMTREGEAQLAIPAGESLIVSSREAWKERLATLTKNIPVVHSDIKGLDDYYKRSVLTGLVCVWENPAYALNPFPSECGIDGGATCLYPWGMSYVPNMTSLMFDQYAITIARKPAAIDLQQFYALTLNGEGAGVKYAYNTYAFVVICDAIFHYFGPQRDLFLEAKRIVLEDEEQRQENLLIDYGLQHHLLEMRGAGWEHVVVSPNAERVWSLRRLAAMGKQLGYDWDEIKRWEEEAAAIALAIQKHLWDDEVKWFKSIYPGGYHDYVWSVQVFDVLRTGVCTTAMKEAVIDQLKEGLFLAGYGVESISKADRIHHEVVDTDWSGGGAYTGDGPQVALTMYEQDEPAKAWDILQRHFWMGEQLLYYPQEHLVDKPITPRHKRSTIYAGLIGAEAILFGLAGFQPDGNGRLFVNPQLSVEGTISIIGFGFRGTSIDVHFSKENMKIVSDGKVIYDGKPQKIKVF